ncbi:Dormancy/auxin associated family protein, partial [Striga hermonthica]
GGEGSSSSKYSRSVSMPESPGTPPTPGTPSPTGKKENVWRSVFHPGSNLATKTIGSNYFDKPSPNSPTVYDWLYSGESRSKHR